jgi:hypothetical protein
VEDEGMKLTVVGAAVILAAIFGAVWLVKYRNRKIKQAKALEK